MKKNKLLLIIPIICTIAMISYKTKNINIKSIIYKTPANTAFTDENFYKCIIDSYNKENNSNIGYSTNLTDEQLSNISSLECEDEEIADITGIEKLTALDNIDLKDNQLTTADLSKNQSLSKINLSYNQLTNINLGTSPNLILEELNLNNNELTTVDVSKKTVLQKLYIRDNNIADIDLSHNTALTELKLEGNQLTSIDLNNNTGLTHLNLWDNQLTDIDLSHNTALKELDIRENILTSLDLSQNTALTKLDAGCNKILDLDLKNNTALTKLTFNEGECDNLYEINEYGPYLTNLTTGENLENLSLHYTNLTNIDLSRTTTLKSLNISGETAQIENIDLTHNPNLEKININGNLTNINLGTKTLLTELSLPNNQLTNLDLSGTPSLQKIDLSENNLTSINLGTNSELEQLNLKSNQLTNIDLSTYQTLINLNISDNQLSNINLGSGVNLILESLDLRNNNLTNLDLSNKRALKEVKLSNNEISNLDLSNKTSLTSFDIRENENLETINFSGDTTLESIYISDGKLTSINLNNTPLLTSLTIGDTTLADIDLSNNAALTNLSLFNNEITNLDLSHNTDLININLRDNKLTNIDLSNNTELKGISLENNQLTSINLSQNTALQSLELSKNNIAEIDLSHNTALIYLGLEGNQITNLDLSHNTALTNNYTISPQQQTYTLYWGDTSNVNDKTLKKLINEEGIKNKYSIYITFKDPSNNQGEFKFDYHITWIKATTTYEIDSTNNYIYTGLETNEDTINNNINVEGSTDATGTIENNKYIVKYNDEVLKEFDIVNISSDEYDLTKNYIIGNYEDIVNNINVTNGNVNLNLITNKIEIKHGDNVLQQFDFINYSSNKYDLTKDTIKVNDNNIETLLSNINCTGCNKYIYDGTNNITTGEFGDDYKLRIIYGDEILKEYNLTYAVNNVSLNTNNLKLNLDTKKTYELIANITPSNAENKNVTWESSDTNVATVDENGLVTAKSLGEATITVTTEDGDYTDTCNVTVSEIITHTVTFIDGENTYTDEFEENENIVFKTNLEKAGYKLKGWKYNNQEYKLTDQLKMPNNDIELTAIWEIVKPQIKNYQTNDNNMTGISLKTNISDINLGINEIYNIQVSDHKGTKKQSGLLGTGDKVKIYLDDQLVSEYEAIVKGDITGTGTSTVSDVAKLYQYLKGKITMDDCYVKAGNVVNTDNEIKIGDVAKLYQYIKGKINKL